jgi:hypothetical protein
MEANRVQEMQEAGNKKGADDDKILLMTENGRICG